MNIRTLIVVYLQKYISLQRHTRRMHAVGIRHPFSNVLSCAIQGNRIPFIAIFIQSIWERKD